MTDIELTPPSSVLASQATRIEQARAVAEVAGAIKVAQEVPRDTIAVKREMLDTCANAELAARAFFRFPRDGNMITGPSVHLARELARCWGNLQYGIDEMRRDDVAGESEMLAWAWDVQSNTRVKNSFIVPHKRDTKKGVKALTDMRDIYENNTNAASRRMRECIFAVLPPWFIEQAKERCRETIANGGGKPLVDRISDTIKAFAGLRQPVTQRQLEDKIGAPASEWTADELVVLQVIGKSLKNGEVTRDDEFPPATVKGADLPTTPDTAATVLVPAATASETSALLARIHRHLHDRGYDELPENELLDDVAVLAGVEQLGDLTHLTIPQMDMVAGHLDRVAGDAHPDRALDALLANLKDNT